MEGALANAVVDGVIPRRPGFQLRTGCGRRIRSINRYPSPNTRPVTSLIPAPLRTLWRAVAVERAHAHLERCIEYLDGAIDTGAAGLVEHDTFEERMSATIEMLNTATSRDDESDT